MMGDTFIKNKKFHSTFIPCQGGTVEIFARKYYRLTLTTIFFDIIFTERKAFFAFPLSYLTSHLNNFQSFHSA